MTKVVLVTGVSGGIGLDICKKFKEKKWIVIGSSRTVDFTDNSIDLYIPTDLSNSGNPREKLEQPAKKKKVRAFAARPSG